MMNSYILKRAKTVLTKLSLKAYSFSLNCIKNARRDLTYFIIDPISQR